MKRAAGVLLHPSCLPGPFGIGDLGPEAINFIDWLSEAGQSIWQVLPLSPVDASGSPYRSCSAFAGNPLLISPQLLHELRLIDDHYLDSLVLPPGRVDFPAVARRKQGALREAVSRPRSDWPDHLRLELESFLADQEIRDWLDDWALFAALKDELGGSAWHDWPADLRTRQQPHLDSARLELREEIDYHVTVQFLFFHQWQTVQRHAHQQGVRLMGDLAIYVAPDSADVWANQEIFDLDETGRPRTVAGVPPDYFSATGQLWGNPLYLWERLAGDDFDWWIRRLRWSFRLADVLRLDHFRGFASYWQVDADEETAVNGRWQPGPGLELFTCARNALGDLPLIAEDLGIVTPDVRELRQAADLPGMRVLQFGLGDRPNEHTPHRLERDTAVYTGTHDNNTTRGWFAGLEEAEQRQVLDYLGGESEQVASSLVRVALTSPSDLAIIPLQDILDLDSEARLNAPGEAEGQWSWRLSSLPGEDVAHSLYRLTAAAERLPQALRQHGTTDS